MSDISVINWGRAVPYTTPTGIETTLYNIGTLADALGRTSQTIRKWEIGGVLPPTPFKIQGKRFYSKEHIEAIVNSAEKSNIQQGKEISGTKFSERIYKEFDRINILFFGEKK